MEGFKLKAAEYTTEDLTEKQLEDTFNNFFYNNTMFSSSYKYVFFKSLIDSIVKYKKLNFSFMEIFKRFTEIYWVLVVNYGLNQNKVSNRKTQIEDILKDYSNNNLNYSLESNDKFNELNTGLQNKIIETVEKKCSRYVIGALYSDTLSRFYSFSKERKEININPLMFDYVIEHYESLEYSNYFQLSCYLDKINNKSFIEKLKTKNKYNHLSDVDIYVDLLMKSFPFNYLFYKTNYGENENKYKKIIPSEKVVFAQKNDEKKERDISSLDSPINSYEILLDAEEKLEKTKDFEWENDYAKDLYIDNDYEFVDEKNFYKMLDDPEKLIKELKNRNRIKLYNNEKMKNSNLEKWDEEEVIILVSTYFRTKNLNTSQIKSAQEKISILLRKRYKIINGELPPAKFRNFSGIHMQSQRIKCLDPDTSLSGMQGTKLQKKVVDDFLDNPEEIYKKAKKIYEKYC